uniref:Uncharacterized protein n=1 Tax=Oryza barthii TaxID=65489 RepID=A0A0D3GHJ1_9ORYZ
MASKLKTRKKLLPQQPQVASLQVEAVAASETLTPQPSHQRIVSQVDVYHRLMAAAAAAVAAALLGERRGQED